LYGSSLQVRLCKQENSRLQYCNQYRQKGWRDQRKFDRRCPPLRNAKATNSSRPTLKIFCQIFSHTSVFLIRRQFPPGIARSGASRSSSPAIPTSVNKADEKNRLRSTRHMHVPEIAAELRDRLLAELNELGCANDAASWAQRCLPEKNKLAAADAKRVEEAFTAKLTSFVVSVADTSDATEKSEQPPTSHGPDSDGLEWSPSKLIDKSALAWPEPRRLRDRNHVRFVADQPCLICARRPSDAHHLRFAQSRALGRKVSDEFTVPMCRGHHREVHRSGDEAAWWRRTGTDPSVAARALWLDTHPLSP
jgi:hypothetical protein